MVFSKTATGTSGNGGQYDSRSSGVSMFVVHHAASSSLEGVLSMMSSRSRQVSSNYVIKDSAIIGVVPEEYRSWSLGSAKYDSKAITVETCNSATGDVSGWPISEASYASLARLIADCATRYGFPIDRDHVVGHREIHTRYGASYPTACPGGIDLDRVVREAQQAQVGDLINTLRGGAMTCTIRNIENGDVFVVGELTTYHEKDPGRVNIANEVNKLGGGAGKTATWNTPVEGITSPSRITGVSKPIFSMSAWMARRCCATAANFIGPSLR